MFIGLSLLTLLISVLLPDSLLGLGLMAVVIIAMTVLFYRHLSTLLDADGLRTRRVRFVTVFDACIFGALVLLALIFNQNILVLSDRQAEYLVALIIALVIFVLGNVSPTLPFNRYVGLRLPWTVTNERAWIAAHRILGYLSFPLGILYLAGVATNVDFRALTFVVIVTWIGIPGFLSFVVALRGL